MLRFIIDIGGNAFIGDSSSARREMRDARCIEQPRCEGEQEQDRAKVDEIKHPEVVERGNCSVRDPELR
ncbi:hypothetical protein KQX54_016460 [Cotesia glomerata]|uniref:Uncharacterized protein n=1 Tax=Cotesia glomerata TaxID=32391 RepID=A0AAV7HUT0_COTGL|nr:hypothetical protein KQX54_016460 [Cotesia glomerata]